MTSLHISVKMFDILSAPTNHLPLHVLCLSPHQGQGQPHTGVTVNLTFKRIPQQNMFIILL